MAQATDLVAEQGMVLRMVSATAKILRGHKGDIIAT